MRNRNPNMTQNEHIYAICCRPEVVGDVFSGENVNTAEGYVLLYFEAARFTNFRYIQQNSFRDGGGGDGGYRG